MVGLWRASVGGIAVVLGVGWVIAPTRMSRLQTRVIHFGRIDYDYDQTARERAVGRVTGGIMAVLGVAFLLGYAP